MGLDFQPEITQITQASGVRVLEQSTLPAQSVQTFANNKKPLEELAQSLGITVEQLQTILDANPEVDFFRLTRDKQTELVNKFNNTPAQTQLEPSNEPPIEIPLISEPAANSTSFDKKKYNGLQAEEKFEVNFKEFARNLYIYGIKDKNGNVVLEPHGAQAWEQLDTAQQNAFIQACRTNAENDKKFQEIIELESEIFLDKKDRKVDFDENQYRNRKADTQMRYIQAANLKGMSYFEFMQLDRGQRLDAIDEYLNLPENQDTLSENDRNYMERRSTSNARIASYVSERFGVNVPENITSSQALEFLRYYNLSLEEVRFAALDKQVQNGEELKPMQKKFYDDYKKGLDLPAVQYMTDSEKALNLRELSTEYEQLKAKISQGVELTEDETRRFNMLETTLNTEDARRLLAFKPIEPKNDAERDVYDFVQNLNVSLDEQFGDDINLYSRAKINDIEAKLNSLPENERYNYLQSIIKFDPKFKLVAQHFLSKPEYRNLLTDESLVLQNSLHAHLHDDASYKGYMETAQRGANSANKEESSLACCAMNTQGKILKFDEFYKKEEFDTKKSIYASTVADVDNTELHKTGIDVATTMKDVKKQAEAVDVIQNGEYATDELQVHITNRAPDLYAENQEIAITTAMNKSRDAFNNVVENDIISKLTSPDAQRSAIDAVYNSGDKQAIETVINNLSNIKNPEVRQQELDRALSEILLNDKKVDLHEKFLSGNLTYAEVRELPASERRKYYDRYFNSLPQNQKIKFLKEKLYTASERKTAYTMIARTNVHLFNEICKEKTMADNLLSMGLPEDVNNKISSIVSFLAVADIGFQEIAQKYDIEYDMLEEYPQTAKTFSYSSIPNGFNNDKFDMFGKDRFGNLLA